MAIANRRTAGSPASRPESGLTKTQIIAELTRSSHGKLDAYVPVAKQAVAQDPEFFAHLVAWNHQKGQVRDSKVALPVLGLFYLRPSFVAEAEPMTENSLAHIASLDPRNLVRALAFAREVQAPGRRQALRRVVERYLRVREENWSWWERTALQHRESLKTLYALGHVKPEAKADLILFKRQYPKGTLFEAVANLKIMSPAEAAGTIIERRIPFLVAQGALGERIKTDSALALALIERMSPTELVTNTKMLERMGVKTDPVLRAAYEDGLARVAKSKWAALKTSRAAEAMTDEGLKAKLEATQERQIANLAGVEGNWLVLGDKSGSMEQAIDLSRMVAATLARMVKGQVHLVFFDYTPRYLDASGKTYEELKAMTRLVRAEGGTSIGCGVQYALERGLEIDGIAIVSDGGENGLPMFAQAYRGYCQKFDKEPTVYFYKTMGQPSNLEFTCQAAGIDLQVIDLRQKDVDYYSLPNLVQTMRTNRYSLADEVLATPLLTLEQVFKKREIGNDKGEEVN